MARGEILSKKRRALEEFVNRLLESEAGKHVARVVLFGSVAREEAEPDSDVDVYVEAFGDVEKVRRVAADLGFESMLHGEGRIEPIVGHILDSRRPPALPFVRRLLKEGREVYRVDGSKLRIEEARSYLVLASEYLKQSRALLPLKHYRLLVDGAYNAAELAVKGLLAFKGIPIPHRHGSIVQKFAQAYILSGEFPRELGRRLNRGLTLRNQARYAYLASITETEAKEMLSLAEELIQKLEEKLAEG